MSRKTWRLDEAISADDIKEAAVSHAAPISSDTKRHMASASSFWLKMCLALKWEWPQKNLVIRDDRILSYVCVDDVCVLMGVCSCVNVMCVLMCACDEVCVYVDVMCVCDVMCVLI